MATFKQGDMWTRFGEVDIFLVTTNSYVKSNGELVMGAGIAKQARDRFQHLAARMGEAIRNTCGHMGVYGVFMPPTTGIGAFQVKTHFKDQADIRLIEYSTDALLDFLKEYPDKTVALNFPGIGNGRLPYEQVKPLLDLLPDNVEIWTYEHVR